MKLPIKLDDLLRQRTVESERIEYKAGWNPDAVLRTVCAFANDFANLGGGYVVIGQDCDANGQPVFPPVGLADNQLDKIQRELRSGSACLNSFPRFISGLRAGCGRCRVVHGGGRRLRRTDRRGGQLGEHQDVHLMRPASGSAGWQSSAHRA
jgi:Putative DNA-binding domain